MTQVDALDHQRGCPRVCTVSTVSYNACSVLFYVRFVWTILTMGVTFRVQGVHIP